MKPEDLPISDPEYGPRDAIFKEDNSKWTVGCFLAFIIVLAFNWLILFTHQQMTGASNWRPVPCVITSSEATPSPKKPGKFMPLIGYEFVSNETTNSSTRYHFEESWSATREEAQKIADSFVAGSDSICYVAPGESVESVLNPKPTLKSKAMFGGGIVSFMCLMGLLYRARRGPAQEEHLTRLIPPMSAKDIFAAARKSIAPPPIPTSVKIETFTRNTDQGPLEYSRPFSAIKKLIPALLTVGIFGWLLAAALEQLGPMAREGRIPSWLFLLLIPFAFLFCRYMLPEVIRFFLGLFNPWPKVKIEESAILPGGMLTVHYSLHQNPSAAQAMRIKLVRMEEVSYLTRTRNSKGSAPSIRRVSGSYLEETQTLFQTSDPIQAQAGKVTLTIPKNLIPTTNCGFSKIQCALRVSHQIQFGPDTHHDFNFTILPPK